MTSTTGRSGAASLAPIAAGSPKPMDWKSVGTMSPRAASTGKCRRASISCSPESVTRQASRGSAARRAAKNAAGSAPATAPATSVVALAPIPLAVAGSAAAESGQAGAVVTADGVATVTWQPGAVPVGSTVSLGSDGTIVSLGLAPTATLPWPVDITYAAAPAGQDVGISQDGTIWTPVGTATAPPALPAGFLTGTYTDASGMQHVLTRKAAQFKLFAPGSYGDPRLVSRYAPRLRRVAAIRVQRLRSGAAVVRTRMSVPSQALILPTHRRIMRPGSFPLAIRVRKGVHHVTVTAVDPYGRRGSFTLSF